MHTYYMYFSSVLKRDSYFLLFSLHRCFFFFFDSSQFKGGKYLKHVSEIIFLQFHVIHNLISRTHQYILKFYKNLKAGYLTEIHILNP